MAFILLLIFAIFIFIYFLYRNKEHKPRRNVISETKRVSYNSPSASIPRVVSDAPAPSQVANSTRTPSQISSKKVDEFEQERPYKNYSFDELERITNSEWNNLEVLAKIHRELEFRSRKKAHDLHARISAKLAQLQNKQFGWPTTTATNGSQNLSSDVFKQEEGLLKYCGYKVGASGLPENRRRQILDNIFLHSLPSMGNSSYLQEWGEPSSERRLKKLAESIAAFTRNARRRNSNGLSKAIQDWESDLTYLKQA